MKFRIQTTDDDAYCPPATTRAHCTASQKDFTRIWYPVSTETTWLKCKIHKSIILVISIKSRQNFSSFQGSCDWWYLLWFSQKSPFYTLLAVFIRFENLTTPVPIMLNKETKSYLKNGEKKILKLCNVLVRLIRHLLRTWPAKIVNYLHTV